MKFIYWPRDLATVKRRFSFHGFTDVIGAIDGSYIPIKKPHENGNDYICRKQEVGSFFIRLRNKPFCIKTEFVLNI